MSSLNWKHSDDHVSVGSLEQYERNEIFNKAWREEERAHRRFHLTRLVSRSIRERYLKRRADENLTRELLRIDRERVNG